MNGAPETLVSSVLKTGLPLAVRDPGLRMRLYLETTIAAEDFSAFAEDYRSIRERSSSLSPEDRTRLGRRLVFLKEELQDLPQLAQLTLSQYLHTRSMRRGIERWAENVVNATIDIAKIVLASQAAPVPQTYAAALGALAVKADLSPEEAQTLSGFARLRNLLAHEYLELLYERIRVLIDAGPALFQRLLPYMDAYLGGLVAGG